MFHNALQAHYSSGEVQRNNGMSTTLLVLLTFCATATANVLCPNAIQIREKDVKLSVFGKVPQSTKV
ncbi:hypothetical protein Y032_0009g705 [Ancylostoma ceylanicum]|uniref:Uncharacterized protein n=1 Tax=Ancylostoma ceylanicum TaxID=53326 RepID=A0A016VJ00_9BILA|nr:hypothetical protein Y032_0009g705 [Ancylostoma ceylanicum]